MVYLSVPMIFYMWLKPHDVKGRTLSDLQFLADYLKRTHLSMNDDTWAIFRDGLIWNIICPIGIAWILQYLLVLAWDSVRGFITKQKQA